jgi:hypothetical protein
MTENLPEDLKKMQVAIGSRNKLFKNRVTPEDFMVLLFKECKRVKRINIFLNRMEKFIFSPEFFYSLEDKYKLALMDFALKYKQTSLSFLVKMYEVSSKNDILKRALDNKGDYVVGSKKDEMIEDIVNKLKLKAKDMEANNDLSKDT